MRPLLLLAAGVLIVGALPMPIGYYTLLRILVTVIAVLTAVNEYKGEVGPTQILFGVIAVLFNPLLPVYLHDKGVWVVIDIAAAVVFLVKSFAAPSTKTP